MQTVRALKSPRSKPIGDYSLELAHLKTVNAHPEPKARLLEGLLQELKYKVNCMRHPRIKSEMCQKLEQELLWAGIDLMEKKIVQKRLEKEQMEDNICMYFEELADIEDLLCVKSEIKNSLLEDLDRYSEEKHIKDTVTQTSLDTEDKDTLDSTIVGSSAQSHDQYL